MSWKLIIKAPRDYGSPIWGRANAKEVQDLTFNLRMSIVIDGIDSDLKSLKDEYDYPLVEELYNAIEMALMQKLEDKTIEANLDLTELKSQIEEEITEVSGWPPEPDSLDDTISFTIQEITVPRGNRMS